MLPFCHLLLMMMEPAEARVRKAAACKQRTPYDERCGMCRHEGLDTANSCVITSAEPTSSHAPFVGPRNLSKRILWNGPSETPANAFLTQFPSPQPVSSCWRARCRHQPMRLAL